jgi:hypothetical protein
LLAEAREYDRGVKQLKCCVLDPTAELTETGFAVVSRFKTVRTEDRLHRSVRKRLSREDLETFLKFVFRLGLGTAPLPENALPDDSEDALDEKVIISGLGLHRASNDRLPSGERTLTGSIREPLMHLAQDLHAGCAARAVNTASENDVIEARDELRYILEQLSMAGRALEQKYGKHAFGLGIPRLVAEQGSRGLARLLSLWIFVGKESKLRTDAARFIAELKAGSG